MDAYDVIIIGTGAGGGTLARHLAPSGKRILMLERGDWLPREPQNWLAQDVFVDNRYVSRGHVVRRGRQGRSSRRSTTSWAARPSSTARRSTGCAREDFGELSTTTASRPRGRSRYDELEPYYTKAEQLYEVHGARGEDPTEALASAPYPFPARLARAAHPAALRRPRGGRPPPVPRALRDPARTSQHAVQRVRPLRQLRRLPVRRARQVRRRGARRPARARASERRRCSRTRRSSSSRRTTPARPSRASSSSATARRGPTRPTSSSLACGAANTAKLLLVSANDKHPNGLANGSDQVGRNYMFHNSLAVLALSREENPTDLPEDPRPQRLLLRRQRPRLPARATSRWSASRRRRCSAASSPARRSSRRSGRSRGSRSTRSTSGSRPRTCRCPRTASRVDDDGKLTLSYHATNDKPKNDAAEQLHSMLGKLRMEGTTSSTGSRT